MRIACALMAPPSSELHATGRSARARPSESVTRTTTGSGSVSPTRPARSAPVISTRALAGTGSASALTAGDVLTPSTAMDSCCRPGNSPRHQTVFTMPRASEVSNAGCADAAGEADWKPATTPAIGRPLRETICAVTGTESSAPAGPRCPSPPSTVIEPATGVTSSGSDACSGPAIATSDVLPALTPTASAPSTFATAGSGADQVTSAPTMGLPRASTTRAPSGRRSPSGT